MCNERVSEKEWIVVHVFGLVFCKISYRRLIEVQCLLQIWLVNDEVSRSDDKAVGGDFVTSVELNDIADDEIPDWEHLHLAALAAVHC